MTPTRIALLNLAYELRMTVSTLTASMTLREFSDWVEWFKLRAEKQAPPAPAPGSGVGMTLDLTTAGGVAQLATMFDKG